MNILQFIHQKCEQIDILVRLTIETPGSVFSEYVINPYYKYVAFHTKPENIIAFKSRILACYSPVVKRLLGRDVWDWAEFLQLPEVKTQAAGTYQMYAHDNSSYNGAAASLRESPNSLGGLCRRERQHGITMSLDPEVIQELYKNRKTSPADILFCHVLFSKANQEFHLHQDRSERTQQGWAWKVLAIAFDLEFGSDTPLSHKCFLCVLESLDILFCRSLQHDKNLEFSDDCHQLSGHWPKSPTRLSNRAMPWDQRCAFSN